MSRRRRERDERRIKARLRELRAERADHPAPEEIAALVEHGMAGPQGKALRAHLSRCRRCFALYSELVHVVTDSPLVAPASEVPGDWARLGRTVAGPAAEVRVTARSARWRTLVKPAAAAAAVLALVSLLRPLAGPREAMPASETAAIRAAWVRVIPEGWLVPGDPPAAREGPVFRSDEHLAGPALQEAIEQLVYRYEDPATRSEEVAYWLAGGYLAGDDHRGARVVLEEARRLYPESMRLAMLQAVLDFRETRFDRAEAALRSALEISPRDAALVIDLAVVLAASDRSPESRVLLQEVAGRLRRGDPLRTHAEALLSGLPAPAH